MSYLLDKNGKLINKHIARKRILVIDLGFYTLNLLGLDKLDIMKESTSLLLGVEKAYKLLRRYLVNMLEKLHQSMRWTNMFNLDFMKGLILKR